MPQTVIEVDIEEDLKQVDIEIEKAVDTVRNDLRELVVNDHARKVPGNHWGEVRRLLRNEAIGCEPDHRGVIPWDQQSPDG